MNTSPEEETWSDNGVECPWCGHLNKDSGDGELYPSGECGSITCGECQKEIDFSIYISYSWTAYKGGTNDN